MVPIIAEMRCLPSDTARGGFDACTQAHWRHCHSSCDRDRDGDRQCGRSPRRRRCARRRSWWRRPSREHRGFRACLASNHGQAWLRQARLECSGARCSGSRNGAGVCRFKLLWPICILRLLQLWGIRELRIWVIRAADIWGELRGNCAGISIVWIIRKWIVWILWSKQAHIPGDSRTASMRP